MVSGRYSGVHRQYKGATIAWSRAGGHAGDTAAALFFNRDINRQRQVDRARRGEKPGTCFTV